MNQAQQTIINWKSEQGFSSIEKLARFLGVKPNTLFTYQKRGFITKKLMQKYERLTSSERTQTPLIQQKLESLKEIYEARTNIELARALNISHMTVNGWVARDHLPLKYEFTLLQKDQILKERLKAKNKKAQEIIALKNPKNISQRLEVIRMVEGKNIKEFCKILSINASSYKNIISKDDNAIMVGYPPLEQFFGVSRYWYIDARGDVYDKLIPFNFNKKENAILEDQ